MVEFWQWRIGTLWNRVLDLRSDSEGPTSKTSGLLSISGTFQHISFSFLSPCLDSP